MRTVRVILPMFFLQSLMAWPNSFAQSPREPVHTDVIAKIKEEGKSDPKVMETVSFLTDVHGPRLTGSPLTRASR